MRNPVAVLSKSDAVITRWGSVLTVIAGIVLIILALMVFVDVFARYVFRAPIEGVLEIASILLGYIVFLPQTFTLASGGHVQVSLFTRRLPPRGQLWFDILACLVGLFIISISTYDGWFQFWESLMIRERMGVASILIPWYVGKFAMPAGLFLFAILFLNKLLLNVAKLLRQEVPLEEIMKPTGYEE